MNKFTDREVKGGPSSDRTSFFKKRYLISPLMVDIEYIKHLTASHKKSEHLDILLRRATDHAYAMSNVTPVIHDQDRLLGNKTRFIRGAIPYLNYASDPFIREIKNEVQDAQSKHNEQGKGGGIEKSLEMAVEKGYAVVSGKFLMTQEEYKEFKELCSYWEGKSFMDLGNALWKKNFANANYITDGWDIGMFTAPHEPCPEGRIILDYEYVLKTGYAAIIEQIRQKMSDNAEDEQGQKFWAAAIVSINGAIDFIQNYATEAQRLADTCHNSVRQQELFEQASICSKIATKPAYTFREAIQLYWFTYLIGHMEGSHMGYSPGRLDYVLAPYLKQDTTTSLEMAVSLFEELFVKMTQIEYIASLSWQGLGHGNMYQNAILGGIDENGERVDGSTSLAILQAQINMQMTQPTISVWYHEKNSEEFHLKAIECVKTGVGYPAFFNQTTYIAHEQKISGLPLDIIQKYSAVGGCTEPTLQGCSYGIVQAGFVNNGKILDLTLNDGVDPFTGKRMFESREVTTYEELRRYCLDIMSNTIHNWQEYWNIVMEAHKVSVPLVFCSALVNNCIERGRSMDHGGALLEQSITTISSGMVNLSNSFAVIKKLVYDDKVITLNELKQAIHANWEGYDALRRKALDVPHWGNDDDYCDDIFVDFYKEYCRIVRAQNNFLGKPYDPTMLAISTPVPFGRVCEAFPDGRYRFEPIADGVTSAFPGTDLNGPTAVIRSCCKVDHTEMRGGLLNLKFHPSAIKGENGSRNLLALMKTYFSKNTFHVQFNIVDSNMLRDAQLNPDKYRDLVVRVAGFSAYWVEMSKALQDQVIWRTEHDL
ncbi:MAG: pyruvate formate lyase family protein [Bacteroidales bacterium]